MPCVCSSIGSVSGQVETHCLITPGEKRNAVRGIPREEKSGIEEKMSFELTKIDV